MSHMPRRDSNTSRRIQRQAEAKVRQELREKRSPKDQLAKLGGLCAKKERAKLLRSGVTTPEMALQMVQVPTPAARKSKKAPKPK